ncbi:hypothetical protein [Akkermansia muciniphila]|jgi:hypothetical protein|uniref:hypothetical protein n=1 Tax=Akkermansia muciniphila TaxID=239935 RepID=UPI000C9B9599|nr:hypothetical protein [Akkermansia muciniphila]PNC81696.1 hypothetical protein CXT92_08800 [Akkermansia muciniphila]PND12710.1 hypothetical protein CXT96_10210 [Akkermansia muciniphila]
MFGNDISQVAAQAREFERSGKRDKFLEESANAVYDDGEGRQLFPVEIDPAMDRYLRQKGEGWQADAYRSWQRGKMLAADLRKGGDDPMKAEKERVLGEERAKVQEYVNERTRRGMPLFPDALAFKSAQEDEAEYARRKDKVDWHRSVFNGDLKKVPESVKKEFEAQFFPDNELGDELRARSLVLGWALDEGGYTENQVSARNGVPLLEQMAIRLKEQGEQIDFNKPGLTVYRFLSRRAQEDAHADELLKGAAESVRQAVLTGGDGRQALWEQRGQMGEEMYKKVGNTLRWVKADAERTRRGLEPVLPRVMEGLEWAVKYADGTANRIFQPEGMASIHQALKAMDGLTDAQMDALAEIVQRKGGNEGSYMANVWKAGNRGWEDLGNGIRSLLRGGIAAQLDVAGGVKELFGGDGSALKADAKAADEYGRRLDAFLAMAQGTYRPINKPEYGWFGNGVLSAVRSVPITALSFSGVGAGVAAMSYAGDSYSKAVQERPDGGRLARLGGAAASGAVQGALDRAGAIVAKGVMGLRSGSAFVDKWMSKLSLSRQAMRLKSSALRAGARSGVAGGMVLGEEMTTEKLQDLADPVMQSLASVMAGEAPGIDWERFWKDFTNRDQNMELFGSVLAFALVGAGARFTAEAGMQRQLSREYGKLKRTFGFSDSLLARMRAEESDVARYAMMQDGIQDFMRQNYGKEVDGVKVGLGDADGMRKLAARGGVRTMDVVAAAEAHAAETARGVDEVRVDGAEVQEGKGAVVGVKGPESGGVSEVGSGPVLSFEHGPVPERKGGRQVDEKEAMKQYVEAVNEQLREFGASPIREERNEFTEEMQFVVELGDRPEFYDSYDDAYEAVLRHLEEREDEVVAGLKSGLRQYRDKGEGYVGRVQDEANEEMMQHLSDVGQDGRMSFDRSKMNVKLMYSQLKNESASLKKSVEGRERIYAAQIGELAGVDASKLRIYGTNVGKEFENGRYEVVSRLYRGANPFDVYEEWTEGMTKVLIRDNEWTVAEFEDELKRLEEATGERFLATGEGVDRLQAVCEGVSRAARAHLMGHISDERLPDKLRRWFKMFALLFAKYFEFAQDLRLAKKMLGADVQEKMSEKFRRLLNDFAGFDEEAIAERARREEQAQIEAEAMGDVPEIGEWVAGRLPHPKTAAEAGSDLTGELQRIYDALTTTRTAKGRRKKDGTLGKGFEQRVVARAEQFFSRDGGSVSDVLEAANEAGFDFADSGDLLSAVYDSVVYGYKRYAARGEGQEVSFSMGDRVRRVPLEEARRVADAFHRVEGMGPVQVDVAGAYEMHLKDALRSVHPFVKVMQERSFSMGGAFEMMDGRRVKVSGRGWREVKNHAADRRNLAALARLDVLAPKAEFLFHAKNSDPKKKDVKAFYYYAVKAVFPGYERLAEVGEGGRQELAYVTIAVAERNSGEFFYDLDSSSVEDIDRVKGTSPNLPLSRVPNTARKGDAPHEHRLQRVKEFVNYADIFLAGQGEKDRKIRSKEENEENGKGSEVPQRPRVPNAGEAEDGTFLESKVQEQREDVNRSGMSFAMRMTRGGQSVWDYLAGVQGQAFEQEARLYEAMQKRLESALQANGFTRDGVYKDEKGKDDEVVRERMLAVMAVCDAVVTELPRDVRGGIRPEVVASYREEVMEKKTWRGRMNALMRMVKYVDWHIVNEGKKSRFKEFERFRKWAAASVGENRVRRGKMNAEIQKRLDMVERALELDADELETAKNTAEKVVEEKALIGGAEYDEAVEWVRALDAFGGLYERNMHGRLTADLERVQAALDALKEMYAAGRLANEAFWEDRRERIADLLDEAGKGLGREQPVSVNERTGAAKHDVGVGKGMRNLVRGFVSFENLMEDLFGEGKVTEYFAEGIRKARLEFNDVRQRRVLRYYGALYRIARPEEFLKRADRKVDGQVKLGVRRVVDGMLKDLSENRAWGIEVKMPGEFRSERVRIEEARAVAEGKMEAEQMPKWAKNQKAMDALKMALSEIPAKSRKEFVKFSWLEQGAELVEMEMSDLEAAYLLQMSAMPEYEDNLEALGFDEAAIGKVRDHIDVRALRVAEYLGEEYERGYKEYNEVYRRLFGCDMPKVQNYAPGFFVTDNAAEAVDPMESRGSGWLSVGSIKMRRKHYALPRVVSCVNAYWAHSMQMDHWASFAEIMRDMKAVLLNGELGNKIDVVHGAQARKLLMGWVKDLEFDGSQDSGGAGQAQQVVSRVLGAMAQGALSYNLKTCLKQLPAMFSSMADMSPSDAMKGFIGALANPGQLAEVWKSPTIQQRLMQGMSPEMRQALTANRMKVSMLGDAVEAGMLPIGLTDAAFTTFSGGIAYMAAKKKAMKEGLSDEVVEQRALAALDKAVRRTAQPIETEQKSPWEIHANALGRMFMMFRSDPRKQIALSYMALAKWKRGEIGMVESAWRFGQAWVVYGIMNQVIVEFLKWVMGQDDDEEELDLWDRWKGFAVSGAMGAFSGIFGLAEVIEFIYSKLAGEKYMKFSNTMVDHAEALWRGGEGVVRMYNGEEEEYGKVMNQLGRGLNGMGLFAAAGRPEIGAAVQVMGRIVKETKSMAGTWGHLWDSEMAKAKEQQRLIQATKKEEKEERKAKMEERKELMARVKGLDYSSRMKVYQDVGLDKEERKLMENRVKMDGASEVVKAVSRVKKDKRKELVEKLKGTMSDVEYEEFVTELKEKGVKLM